MTRLVAARAAHGLALVAALLLPGACSSPAVGARWASEVVLDAGTKLGGCAVGDVDPRHPGAEVIAVDGTGRVHVAHLGPDGWRSEVAVTLAGEMIQCTTGDVDPSRPGHEIVAVGKLVGDEDSRGPGAVFVIAQDGDGWTALLAREDTALVHGVAVARFDARGHDTILVAGYTRRANLIGTDDGSNWQSTELATLPGDGKSVAALPGPDGGAHAAVGCADGTLLHLSPDNAGTWTARVMETAGTSQARLTAGPARGSILASRNDGTLVLVTDTGTELIHTEPDRLRGAVCADIDPDSDGPELATAGYGATVTVLTRAETGWTATEVARDSDRFHHLTSGALPGHDVALVACGYSGRVILVHRR